MYVTFIVKIQIDFIYGERLETESDTHRLYAASNLLKIVFLIQSI